MIAAAAALLLLAAPAPPLECPGGTTRRGAGPPEGFEEWCEGKDGAGRAVRQGPARTWYDDGRLWIDQRFRDGQRDGPFVEWHRNGGRAREGTFTLDARTGRWIIRGESGRVEEESEWRAGVPHGRYVSYWPSGARRAEGRHCGGAQCGTWRTYDESGKELGAVDYGEQRLSP